MPQLGTHFKTVLKLEEGWGLGLTKDATQWIAIHLHSKKKYGWWLEYGGKCSVCMTPFPKKVVGMMYMLRGLEDKNECK